MADLFKNKFTMELETKNFNEHIRQFLKGTSLDSDIVLRKFAFDLIKRIVFKNPVDTGRSRAGWYPALEGLGGVAPAGGGDPTASADGRSKGSIEFNLGQNQTYKWIEMVNGVDYVIYLEYGHSRQAPYGMVRLSMRELSKQQLPTEMGKMVQRQWNRFYTVGPGGVLTGAR